jgi:autophagy-related protein 9
MMASNILSKLLPATNGAPSVYETFREGSSDDTDIEERAGVAMDEENLGAHHIELDPTTTDAIGGDVGIHDSPTRQPKPSRRQTRQTRRPRWMRSSPSIIEADDDDDVPPSLLVEHEQPAAQTSPLLRSQHPKESPMPIPVRGPATTATRAKWQAAQDQQRLHDDPQLRPAYAGRPQPKKSLLSADPREQTLWRWANVENLDNFLGDVYDYYVERGIWSILLRRILFLL